MSIELDNLINQFNNTLNISESNKMAQPNYQLLKLFVDTIPTYDGNNEHTLNIFISACDNLIHTYQSPTDIQLNTYLLRAILGKLQDRAQILICSRSDLNDWQTIKAALKTNFGDSRNLECLEQDLITLVPNRFEPPIEFGKRIQLLKSRLLSKLNSVPENEMSNLTKNVYAKQYDNLTLKTFIRGLRGNLQSVVRLRNPNSLEAAMNLVTEEENFHYTKNISNLISHNKSNNYYKPQRFHNNQSNSSYFQNKENQISTNFFHNPNNFNNQSYSQEKPEFPSQPINIKQRPIKQKFPTNREVFGPPQNVFKPTRQDLKRNYEPMSTNSRNYIPKNYNTSEPMSISSRIPSLRHNNFKPSGNRNFISEELYQMHDNQNFAENIQSNENFQYNPNFYKNGLDHGAT